MRLFLWAVVALVLFWALLLIFALSPKASKAQTLTCTIPRFGQLRYTDSSYGPDSTMIECAGGDTVLVDSLKLYRYDTGAFRFYRSWYVRGMEGQTFTTDSLPPGQYYMNAKNQYGESCGGNVATVQGTVTGVPTGEAKTPERLPLGRLYDVRGRLVQGKPAAGIYFTKEKKRVVVNSRGEVITH